MFVTHSPREVIEMGDHLTPQDFYEFIDGSLEGYAQGELSFLHVKRRSSVVKLSNFQGEFF